MTRQEVVVVVLAFLLTKVLNDCLAISSWIAVRLVRWAARIRYRGNPGRAATRGEELAALIDDRPGDLFKLFTALGFASHALVTAGPRAGADGFERLAITVFTRFEAGNGLGAGLSTACGAYAGVPLAAAVMMTLPGRMGVVCGIAAGIAIGIIVGIGAALPRARVESFCVRFVPRPPGKGLGRTIAGLMLWFVPLAIVVAGDMTGVLSPPTSEPGILFSIGLGIAAGSHSGTMLVAGVALMSRDYIST